MSCEEISKLMDKSRMAAQLAANIWEDPVREKHCTQAFEAVSTALQAVTLDDGTQDALCIYEAIAIQVGQLVAGLDKASADSVMGFLILRAETYRAEFQQTDKAAKHFVEDLN